MAKEKNAPELTQEEIDTNDWAQAKNYQFLRKGKVTIRAVKRAGAHHIEVHWRNNIMKTQQAFPDPGKAKQFGRALFKVLTNG